MRARCAAERDGNLAVFDAHRDLVLCTGQRQAYPLVARQQRALGQFPENSREFLFRKFPVAVIALRERPARGNEGDRPRAFAADLFQHRVVVARADAEIAGDDLALGFFRQDTGEEGPAFPALEAFLPQRKGLRQGHGAGLVQPVCRVVEKHLAAVILDEMADEIVVQIDIEGSGHGLFFSRRRQGQRDPEGLQDAERFPEFAGFLALLQVDDKPQPRPRSQGEILLRDAQPFAGVPDHAADLLGGVFQAYLQMLPYGNILAGF